MASFPIIPGVISLGIILRRHKLKNNITELSAKLTEIHINSYLHQSEEVMKNGAVEAMETVLNYRNGEKLTTSSITNLNVFSSFVPEISYDLIKINQEYNFQPDDKTVIKGNGFRVILHTEEDEFSESEESYKKVLKKQ